MCSTIECSAGFGYSPVLMIYQDPMVWSCRGRILQMSYIALERRNYGPRKKNSRGQWIEIPNPGKLALPGGGAEVGETPYETARRELREETGQEHDDLMPLHVEGLPATFIDSLDRVIKLQPYSVVTNDPKLVYGGEGESIEWYPLSDYQRWWRELATYHSLIIEYGLHSLFNLVLIDWKMMRMSAMCDYNINPSAWA